MRFVRLILVGLAAVTLPAAAGAQLTVTGRVTDAQGRPLPGAQVFVARSGIGTFTSSEGLYRLVIPRAAQPMTLDPEAARSVLMRPGVLEDISGAFDSPQSTIDGWLAEIEDQTWLVDDEVREYAGSGPMITDDQPRPEYFLLREWNSGRG